MDRTLLVQRYLELQTRAARLGLFGSPHITRDMADDEIMRRGTELAARITAVESSGPGVKRNDKA